MWLPPGGHVDQDELPDDAAVREVLEETGVHIRLVGEHQESRSPNEPTLLTRPEAIQLENIRPDHQHIDLIYFGVLANDAYSEVTESAESEKAGWFQISELEQLGVHSEVRKWAESAALMIAIRLRHGEAV